MVKVTYKNRNSQYITNTQPVTENGIANLFDDLLGISGCKVTFSKPLGSAYFYNDGSNTSLCFVWSETTSNDEKAEIVIILPSDIVVPSEIQLYGSTISDQNYCNRNIILNNNKIILNKDNCLNVDSGSYRNIFACARCQFILHADKYIDKVNSNGVFYKENLSNNGMSSSSPTTTEVNNWAINKGFEGGTYLNLSQSGSFFRYDSYDVGTLYFNNTLFILKNKNGLPGIVKFQAGAYANNNTIAESDNNGQIIFYHTNNPHPREGYKLGLREVNLAMNYLDCYNFTKAGNRENLRDVCTTIKLVNNDNKCNILPNSEDASVVIINTSYPLCGAEYSKYRTINETMLRSLGGYTYIPNFEIQQNGNSKLYDGYSLINNRNGSTILNGNYVYDDSMTNKSRDVLNKTYMGGLNEGYIPIVLYSNGEHLDRDFKNDYIDIYTLADNLKTIAVSINSDTFNGTAVKCRPIFDVNNDILVSYDRYAVNGTDPSTGGQVRLGVGGGWRETTSGNASAFKHLPTDYPLYYIRTTVPSFGWEDGDGNRYSIRYVLGGQISFETYASDRPNGGVPYTNINTAINLYRYPIGASDQLYTTSLNTRNFNNFTSLSSSETNYFSSAVETYDYSATDYFANFTESSEYGENAQLNTYTVDTTKLKAIYYGTMHRLKGENSPYFTSNVVTGGITLSYGTGSYDNRTVSFRGGKDWGMPLGLGKHIDTSYGSLLSNIYGELYSAHFTIDNMVGYRERASTHGTALILGKKINKNNTLDQYALYNFKPIIEERNNSFYLTADSFLELKEVINKDGKTLDDLELGVSIKRNKYTKHKKPRKTLNGRQEDELGEYPADRSEKRGGCTSYKRIVRSRNDVLTFSLNTETGELVGFKNVLTHVYPNPNSNRNKRLSVKSYRVNQFTIGIALRYTSGGMQSKLSNSYLTKDDGSYEKGNGTGHQS